MDDEPEVDPRDVQMRELRRDLNRMQEWLELIDTPFWKRWAFRVNGWPKEPVDETHPQAWRPWHRWWGRRDGVTRKEQL